MDFDELKQQAEKLAHDHSGEIEQGVEKAADVVKDKVGHEDQVDEAVKKIEGFLS
jgi:MT0933-like antitoxin protein